MFGAAEKDFNRRELVKALKEIEPVYPLAIQFMLLNILTYGLVFRWEKT